MGVDVELRHDRGADGHRPSCSTRSSTGTTTSFACWTGSATEAARRRWTRIDPYGDVVLSGAEAADLLDDLLILEMAATADAEDTFVSAPRPPHTPVRREPDRSPPTVRRRLSPPTGPLTSRHTSEPAVKGLSPSASTAGSARRSLIIVASRSRRLAARAGGSADERASSVAAADASVGCPKGGEDLVVLC
jgi:hypothetical protein